MEPVGPPNGPATGPVAPQAVTKVTPVGRGWMLLAVEAGFVLRSAAKGVDLRLAPDDAEALRRGEIAPEALVARSGLATHLPPVGSVTVAFSPEALRLSGRMGGQGRAKGAAPVQQAGPPMARLPHGWIGAGCLALLVLVLIWTA